MSQFIDNAIASLQNLKAKAEAMPAGGDLESLIEEGLAALDRQCYEMCLDARREAAASHPEAFSPSGVPPVRGASARLAEAGAPGADIKGRGAL